MFAILNDTRHVFVKLFFPQCLYETSPILNCEHKLNMKLGVGVGHLIWLNLKAIISSLPDGIFVYDLPLQIQCPKGRGSGPLIFLYKYFSSNQSSPYKHNIPNEDDTKEAAVGLH